MPVVDLLRPISEGSPGGEDISNDKRFLELKAAVRPHHDAKPDFVLAAKLAEALLVNVSKDLRVAEFYTEALVHREGFAGLRRGLDVVRGLLDQYWDSLHPADIDERRGRLAMMGADKLAGLIRQQPISKTNHTYWDYRQANSMPTIDEANADDAKKAHREAMLKAGNVTLEVFNDGLAQTSKEFLERIATDLAASLETVRALDGIGQARFDSEPPSLMALEGAIEDVHKYVSSLVPRTEADTQVRPSAPDHSGNGAEGVTSPSEPQAAAHLNDAVASSLNVIETAVCTAAHNLRKANRLDPTPYLLLRALRWGELRAHGLPLERSLSAPAPDTRSQLRSLYLDGRWHALLDAAEQIMASAAGRGWLDLQFYVVSACEELGDSFDGVRRAVIGALHALLAEFPSLPAMTLMDAMPTASPETQAWIANGIVSATPADGERDSSTAPRPRDVYGAARLQAAVGTPEEAVDLLARQLARETTGRARFLRQTQIAAIMVDKELFEPAQPLLRQLIAHVEKFNLAEWEDAALVAEPFTLMIRCLDARAEDPTAREQYYTRVCTLSPAQAMRIPKT